MSSILDNIEETFHSGDVEALKMWVEAKLESKDKQIAHLLHKIQALEYKLNALEQKIDNKLDIGRFEYEMTMRHEN